MREFLLGLYLKYGEREFSFKDLPDWQKEPQRRVRGLAYDNGFLHNGPGHMFNLTPEALEYIKNLDNP